MKRTVAFLAAVCLSTGVLSATVASAQYDPPKSPPPPPPSEASGDTLRGGSESPVAPVHEPKATTNTAQPAAEVDTTLSAAAKARRMNLSSGKQRSFVFSLGLGSASNYKPDDFSNNFSPSFGGVLAFGVRQYGVTAGVNFNYNFFLANGSATKPDDLNILTIFAVLIYSPTHSRARPYILACGGYFRQWIVNTRYTENVLGYGGGAGVEMGIDKARRLFLDARYIEGQTRETQDESNTVIIPVRLGVTWEFK